MNYDGLKFHIANRENVASHPVLRNVMEYFNGKLPDPAQRMPGTYISIEADAGNVGRMQIGNDVVDVFGKTFVAIEPGVPFYLPSGIRANILTI